MIRRRVAADEWTGWCRCCDDDTTLSVVKADGRWTLRQLFGPSWIECPFDVACRRCGSRWATSLDGAAMSVDRWLEQVRGAEVPCDEAR